MQGVVMLKHSVFLSLRQREKPLDFHGYSLCTLKNVLIDRSSSSL